MPNRRYIPAIEAMMLGLNESEIALLQDALDRFDESYELMLERLKSLGATQNLYRQVNAAIKGVTGKGRGDVDTLDAAEMQMWGDGYTDSATSIDNLGSAAVRAANSFAQAMERWGML